MDQEGNNYITFRKICRTSSLNDLSHMTSSSNKNIFDTTMMSIPDSLHDNSGEINDLSEQVKLLTAQLQSAHLEIENLNNENFRLKSDLQKSVKTINTYKQVCLSPERKSRTPKSVRKTKITVHNTTETSFPNDDPIKPSGINHSQVPSIMIDKETQTSCQDHMQPVNNLKEVHSSTAVNSHKLKFSKKELADIIATTNTKNKLCILSSGYKPTGHLSLMEDVFSDYFDFCHYCIPNGTIKELLDNIEHKLKDFTDNDYCIILMGENDIKATSDYINMINMIRKSLEKVTHTNNVICLPTYITGAPIYNFRVEMFNNLLNLDLQNNDYAYLFDSNRELSLDMFSNTTGKLKKQGMKCIYDGVMNNIIIDLCAFGQFDIPNNSSIQTDPCFVINSPQFNETETNNQFFL